MGDKATGGPGGGGRQDLEQAGMWSRGFQLLNKVIINMLINVDVDGQENTWSNIYGKKFFEVQDGITETNHGIIDYLVVTSVDWLDSLDADVRDQFLTILDEVTELRNAESYSVNQANRQAIIGGVVRTLTASERQAWVDVMKPVWDQFADDVGQDMIDAAQALN